MQYTLSECPLRYRFSHSPFFHRNASVCRFLYKCFQLTSPASVTSRGTLCFHPSFNVYMPRHISLSREIQYHARDTLDILHNDLKSTNTSIYAAISYGREIRKSK